MCLQCFSTKTLGSSEGASGPWVQLWNGILNEQCGERTLASDSGGIPANRTVWWPARLRSFVTVWRGCVVLPYQNAAPSGCGASHRYHETPSATGCLNYTSLWFNVQSAAGSNCGDGSSRMAWARTAQLIKGAFSRLRSEQSQGAAKRKARNRRAPSLTLKEVRDMLTMKWDRNKKGKEFWSLFVCHLNADKLVASNSNSDKLVL